MLTLTSLPAHTYSPSPSLPPPASITLSSRLCAYYPRHLLLLACRLCMEHAVRPPATSKCSRRSPRHSRRRSVSGALSVFKLVLWWALGIRRQQRRPWRRAWSSSSLPMPPPLWSSSSHSSSHSSSSSFWLLSSSSSRRCRRRCLRRRHRRHRHRRRRLRRLRCRLRRLGRRRLVVVVVATTAVPRRRHGSRYRSHCSRRLWSAFVCFRWSTSTA